MSYISISHPFPHSVTQVYLDLGALVIKVIDTNQTARLGYFLSKKLGMMMMMMMLIILVDHQ